MTVGLKPLSPPLGTWDKFNPTQVKLPLETSGLIARRGIDIGLHIAVDSLSHVKAVTRWAGSTSQRLSLGIKPQSCKHTFFFLKGATMWFVAIDWCARYDGQRNKCLSLL